MTSLTITCQGKRFAARITPMQPLAVLVEQVASKLRPTCAAADCELLCDGKPLDLATPFRLANISTSAKLELVTGQPPSLGIRSQSAAASSQPAAEPGPAAMAQPAARAGQEASAAGPSTAGPSAAGPFAAGPPGLHGRLPTAAPAAAPAPSAPGSEQRSQAEASRQPSPAQAALGLEREVAVFTRAQLEAAAPSDRDAELPDSFFEFGPEDYARVMQGYTAAKARAEAGLRTGSMRAAEAAQRARAFPATRLRVLFPDGLALQMRFQSTDTLADVRRSVGPCLAPAVAAGAWHLFVTPPKQVLRDGSASLFAAGLCPAANLHFGCSQQAGGPFLRPEVAALQGPLPLPPPLPLPQPQPPARAAGEGPWPEPRAAPGPGQEGQAGGRKVPRWAQLGRK